MQKNTSFVPETPARGRRTRGRREVMARGRHSEIQKIAITRIVQPHLENRVKNSDNRKHDGQPRHYNIIRVTVTMLIKMIVVMVMMTTMMKMLSLKTMTITKEHLDSLPLQEEAPAEGARELKIICKRRTRMIFTTSFISLIIHVLGS